MVRYMVLYNSELGAADLMSSSSPEKMKASMDEWIKWKDKANQTVDVEFGMPLQAINRVSTDGVTNSINQASGYSFIDAASKAAALGVLRDHPHLKRTGAYIDLLEIMPMPGM